VLLGDPLDLDVVAEVGEGVALAFDLIDELSERDLAGARQLGDEVLGAEAAQRRVVAAVDGRHHGAIAFTVRGSGHALTSVAEYVSDDTIDIIANLLNKYNVGKRREFLKKWT